MLQTLLKIGEWQSQGKSEWDRFLDYPKAEREDKRGNPIKNYTLPIIFDLDTKEVIISEDNLREYNEDDVKKLFLLRTLSARSKKIYGTIKGVNIKYIYNTFFGDDIENEDFSEGNLIESIRKDYPKLLTSNFEEILNEISELNLQFLHITAPRDEKTGKRNLQSKNIKHFLDLDKNEEIAVIYIQVKSQKYGFTKPTNFVDLDEYQNFLQTKFLPKANSVKIKKEQIKKKLCYASGTLEDNVKTMDLSRRDSLNKMFGYKTYYSYLSNFDPKKAIKNYGVSEKNQEYLDYASDYLLKPNCLVYIAGVKHCFLPEFLSNDDVDLEMAINNISNKSDLLFSYKKLDNAVREIKAWTDKPFWITFLSLEIPIDKKYLKTQDIIKDVNVFHFEKVLKELRRTDEFMSQLYGVKWEWINGGLFFNFYSIYKLIPIRDGNTNRAYNILKSIFEGHTIPRIQIYKFYTELILCYYYDRFAGYSNQKKPQTDNHFKNSARNITFKYHAFIQFLKKLNLIDMEETANNSTEEKSENKYDEAIQNFFSEMDMKDRKDQQAMFYLGRMLNAVEYIQLKKQIKKTVIHLVNFNGLDENSIRRLRNDLINKARQHNQVGKVKFLNGQFGDNFKFNSWSMDPNEALFFVLTGYSFRVSIQESEEQENIEITEEAL